MGTSSAPKENSVVHWWEVSQLRILVLSSLVVQWILLLSSIGRRFSIPGWLRLIIWLAYLGSDALAIYALAALFNRHKNQDQGCGNNCCSRGILEVVWAPVLLMHLGGQDGISAYNIEDNELWTRHLATAVSQVTIAVYVFVKSWKRGCDKKLGQAAVMLFIVGIVKCLEKPRALKRASINSLVSSGDRAERRANRAAGGTNPLDNFIQQARELCSRRRTGAMMHINCPYELFVDLAHPYPHRLSVLQSFSGLNDEQAYLSLQRGLGNVFSLLYTKLKSSGFHTEMEMSRVNKLLENGKIIKAIFTLLIMLYSLLIRLSRQVLPWVAIPLFHKSHRKAYDGHDVKITYTLFVCSALLEFCSSSPIIFELASSKDNSGFDSNSIPVWPGMNFNSTSVWPEMVSQYNLVGFFARNKKHSKKMRIVSFFGWKDYLDQKWCMKSCLSSHMITLLVLQHLKDGWKRDIQDTMSYWKFNDHRGHRTLELHQRNEDLGWSLQGPFDESVLLWHIATDICFYSSRSGGTLTVCSRQISNYMMYLLFVKPEMLLPGSRQNLFTAAYDELEEILKEDKPALMKRGFKPAPQVEEERHMQIILSKLKSMEGSEKVVFIREAWELANGLMSLGDDVKMWKVIQGVWVEMLCFSASRCRGYLHAKTLGTGGELLSYVWLLMSHMGMETLTERLQREVPVSAEGRTTGGAVSPAPEEARTSSFISAALSTCLQDR